MDGGFIKCGVATKEWLPQRPSVAVANYEVSITSGVSIAPFGDDVALFCVANRVWHDKRDTRL